MYGNKLIFLPKNSNCRVIYTVKAKLKKLIERALQNEKPRLATQRTEASKENRILSKKKLAEKKQQRNIRPMDSENL